MIPRASSREDKDVKVSALPSAPGEEGGLVQVKQGRFSPLTQFSQHFPPMCATSGPGKVMGAPWEHWVCVDVAGPAIDGMLHRNH